MWRCSLIKEEINFWEEDLTSENQEYVTVIEDIFGTRTQKIVESVLDESNAKVTTGKTLLIAGDADIADDAWLYIFSCELLFVSSKSLAEFL